MPTYYSDETLVRTADLIREHFQVVPEYARRLATAALDGIESHGLNLEDWETVARTIEVVVASWVKDGAFK